MFEPTTPRTPEQNGPAELFGGYIVQIARTMMIASGLPGIYGLTQLILQLISSTG
jgi:hypothetical protein